VPLTIARLELFAMNRLQFPAATLPAAQMENAPLAIAQLEIDSPRTFIYSTLSHSGDWIVGFETTDRLDLRELWRNLGYWGNNPIGDGLLIIAAVGIDAVVRVRAATSERFTDLVTLKQVLRGGTLFTPANFKV
jgi:hypothetical protein